MQCRVILVLVIKMFRLDDICILTVSVGHGGGGCRKLPQHLGQKEEEWIHYQRCVYCMCSLELQSPLPGRVHFFSCSSSTLYFGQNASYLVFEFDWCYQEEGPTRCWFPMIPWQLKRSTGTEKRPRSSLSFCSSMVMPSQG